MPPEVFSSLRSILVYPDHTLICWKDVGAFRIQDGREIVIHPVTGVLPEVLRLFLLGTALGILLHQRGLAVIHASAVAKGDQALLLVGKKGAGKSSLAGAFYATGHRLLSDDLGVVDLDKTPPMVLPGFPHIKLWPDSAAELFDVSALSRLRPELEKLGHRPEQPLGDPATLRAILILDEGPDEVLERVDRQSAVVELMGHWYGARFGRELFQKLGPEKHLRQCAQLVSCTEIFRYRRRNSVQSLKSQALFASGQLLI